MRLTIPQLTPAPVEHAALEGALDEAFWAIIGPLIADAFDLISDITPEAVANALEAYARTIWIGIWWQGTICFIEGSPPALWIERRRHLVLEWAQMLSRAAA